uniref:Uncharacterized protein n=1 Tax=Cannabis sativa TaxID=3483 RepID=A0A803PID8_CANSA
MGELVMVDSFTKAREKLNYPRILIEVSLRQDFPEQIWFEDENGEDVAIFVAYEWKPTTCAHCKGIGHETKDCRNKEGKKKAEWVVKKTANTAVPDAEQKGDEDGFKPAKKTWKEKPTEQPPAAVISVANSYASLQESHEEQTAEVFEQIYQYGEGWCFTANNAWHKGGRIIVSWKPTSYTVNILKCSSQLIHLEVSTVDNKAHFYVTFIYAFNDEEGRKKLWLDLHGLATNEAWVVMGDFNDILAKEERIGKRVRYVPSTNFIDCVANCRLDDVKFSGNYYTWSNKQFGEDRIFSKIDWVLANQEWLAKNPLAEVVFMNEGIFDHSPVVLMVHNKVVTGRKPFKYYRMWENHPTYLELVKKTWQQGHFAGTKMYRVITKLKALKKAFKELNSQFFCDIQAQEIQARNTLDECQDKLHQQLFDTDLQLLEQAAKDDFVSKHKSYLTFLHQKAKLTWVKDGDENSALFHTSIRQRRRQNQVLSITNADGKRVDEPSEVKDAFINYYIGLLGTCMQNRMKVKQGIIDEGPALTGAQIDLLMATVTRDEVKKMVLAIPGVKAPGPDGFGSYFFSEKLGYYWC